ncbi:MAG TPA: MaoC family dehydratase [bacterium]|jgi:acyl dehydratase
MSDRFFDDFRPGERFETPGTTLSESMLLDFAYRYDPQPFHLDVPAAAKSIYGGLIASGFQTLVHAYRMFISEGVFAACAMGSPAMDEVRWIKPVRPGDTLRVAGEVRESRPSRSKPDRGILRMDYQVLNQADEAVMTFSITHLLARRPTS